MEDDLKNLFSIPLKSRGKPFLGLAQLSKILALINDSYFCRKYVFDYILLHICFNCIAIASVMAISFVYAELENMIRKTVYRCA
jgi:hypothetical protein